MEITKIVLSLGFKNWLIIVTLGILIICLIQIRRLKRIIVQEVRRRLVPEVVLELDIEERGIFARNQSTMFAKDISIDNINMTLEDYGFAMEFTLKFEPVDSLKPNERLRLDFDVFKADELCKPEESRRIIPHLISIPFKVKLTYSNLENLRFKALIVKKIGQKKFALIKIEPLE